MRPVLSEHICIFPKLLKGKHKFFFTVKWQRRYKQATGAVTAQNVNFYARLSSRTTPLDVGRLMLLLEAWQRSCAIRSALRSGPSRSSLRTNPCGVTVKVSSTRTPFFDHVTSGGGSPALSEIEMLSRVRVNSQKKKAGSLLRCVAS